MHEVSTMFWTGQPPWHGLGIPMGPDPLTSKEAIVAAGLDWKVNKLPTFVSINDVNTNIPDRFAMVKEDGKILGTVGSRYHPVQNSEAFEFMDSIVAEGKMKYEVAGALRDDKKVWLLGKIGDADIVPGDQVGKYLFLYNSHDGSECIRCMFTHVRVVCMNTAKAALSEDTGVRMMHTMSITTRLNQAKSVLGLAYDRFENSEAFLRSLAAKSVTVEYVDNFVKELFPMSLKNESSVATANRDAIVQLFEAGRGQDLVGVAGTKYALYNAVVEFSNYYKKARGSDQVQQAKRFESSLMGSSAELIDKTTLLLAA